MSSLKEIVASYIINCATIPLKLFPLHIGEFLIPLDLKEYLEFHLIREKFIQPFNSLFDEMFHLPVSYRKELLPQFFKLIRNIPNYRRYSGIKFEICTNLIAFNILTDNKFIIVWSTSNRHKSHHLIIKKDLFDKKTKLREITITDNIDITLYGEERTGSISRLIGNIKYKPFIRIDDKPILVPHKSYGLYINTLDKHIWCFGCQIPIKIDIPSKLGGSE